MNDDISHEFWCQNHDVTSAIKIRIDKVITEYKKKSKKVYPALFIKGIQPSLVSNSSVFTFRLLLRILNRRHQTLSVRAILNSTVRGIQIADDCAVESRLGT